MPPKKVKQVKKKAVMPKRKVKKNSNVKINELTTMMAQLSKPQNQVTDLGRMLLHGGNMLGGLVGLPTIFGSGDYQCTQNSLWGPESQVPFIHSQSETVTMRHREYISDVQVAGAGFAGFTLSVNPGLAVSFPFLSTIAQNFQEYTFKGLVFEYKTTSAQSITSGTNTAMGSVMLAMQYRADAPLFTNKLQLLNEMWSVDTVPSASCVLPIECAPLENPFAIQYVRTGPATGDIKNFDLGTVTVATQGAQAGQSNVVGELWVSYEVELRKPQLVPTTASDAVGGYFFSSTATSLAPFSGFVETINAGGNFSMSGGQIVSQGASGTFIVVAHYVGSSTVGVFGPAFTATNSTVVATTTSGPNPGTATSLVWYVVWTIPNPALVATITAGVDLIPTPTSGANITILQINPLFAGIT